MSLTLLQDPSELRRRFLALKSPADIARLLDIPPSTLTYHLYVLRPQSRYAEFKVAKKRGGTRTILAPVSALKIVQRKLAQALSSVYDPRAPVHGFRQDRSIVTNSRAHTRKRWVLNVDLELFFPTINFGRVRGMFISRPYSLPPNVATVLAQICCHDNALPQGAPTSPVVSNMICSKMDSQLRRLAMASRCVYSRYADDLTLSTTLPKFPGNLASLADSGEVTLGPDLLQVIVGNGFAPNNKKVRLQSRNQRQEVTGLTSNLFPNIGRRYIHQVRAMLNNWRRNGLEVAQARHRALFSSSSRNGDGPLFRKVVKGKIDYIAMVKGRNDPNYRRFLYEYSRLDPSYVLPKEPTTVAPPNTRQAVVYTGGKTDWRHLKAAFARLQSPSRFSRLSLVFREEDDDIGDAKLCATCKAFSITPTPHPVPQLFVFDRDDPRILSDAHLSESDIHDWGMNVFSLSLPIPQHRAMDDPICIELLYKDDDLTRVDLQGRRLFLSSEFHPDSGRHLSLDYNYRYPAKLRPGRLSIIDDDVFDPRHKNVALPKANFAQYILLEAEDYRDTDVSGFEPLFELMEAIVFGQPPPLSPA